MPNVPDLDAIQNRLAGQTAVHCVTTDGLVSDLLDATLAPFDGFEVRTETASRPSPHRLDDADCVVVERRPEHEDPVGAVRDYRPRLPVVVLLDELRRPTVASVRADNWVDVVPKSTLSEAPAALAHRVAVLVRWRRVAGLARHALTAVETVPDGVATAGPDGRFGSVDEVFAARFGYDRETLVGRPWRAVFTDEAADRIESDVLASLDDTWGWCGSCTGRHADGSTHRTRTTVVGLDDGSLVFLVPGGAPIDRT